MYNMPIPSNETSLLMVFGLKPHFPFMSFVNCLNCNLLELFMTQNGHC